MHTHTSTQTDTYIATFSPHNDGRAPRKSQRRHVSSRKERSALHQLHTGAEGRRFDAQQLDIDLQRGVGWNFADALAAVRLHSDRVGWRAQQHGSEPASKQLSLITLQEAWFADLIPCMMHSSTWWQRCKECDATSCTSLQAPLTKFGGTSSRRCPPTLMPITPRSMPGSALPGASRGWPTSKPNGVPPVTPTPCLQQGANRKACRED